MWLSDSQSESLRGASGTVLLLINGPIQKSGWPSAPAVGRIAGNLEAFDMLTIIQGGFFIVGGVILFFDRAM